MPASAAAHQLRLVRPECRDCRHPTPQVVTPCVHCGSPLPRLRLDALSWWIVLAGGVIVLLGFLGAGPAGTLVQRVALR